MGDVKDCIQLAGWVPEYPTYCKRCKRTCRMPMMIPAVIVTHPDTKWGWTMSRRWNIPWYPKDVSYPKNWIPPKNISKISIFSKKTAENHPTIQPSNHPTIQPSPASASGGSLPVGRQPESEPGLSQAGDQPAWLSWKGREFCVTLGGLNHICICICIYIYIK